MMEPYSVVAAEQYLLNRSDDWLQKRQGLALPVLPPTTAEARKYFFSKIREFSVAASTDRKRKVNFKAFTKEWNCTADGKERFYVTVEVLSAYAKSWEKLSNIRASQELIVDQMQSVAMSKKIFLAEEQPFPAFITSDPVQMQPSRGVLDLQDCTIPSSLSVSLASSRPLPPSPSPNPTSQIEMIDNDQHSLSDLDLTSNSKHDVNM
jgi:hypothetical protein